MKIFRLSRTLLALTLQLPVLLSLPAGADCRSGPVTTVSSVDLSRYAGTWYEVAKIPNRFQDQCAGGAVAEYTLREDGRISVENRCIKEDGELSKAEGIARVVEATGNAQLKVSFVSFLGWRPFWGDYWIVGLDSDYGWVAVGTPDRKYGWILSRTPELDANSLNKAFNILELNGYERDAFETSIP